MAKRRANGEGSIYKRKSDDKWTGKLQVGYNPDGSPKMKSVYGNSQKEVKDKIDELKGSVKNNTLTEPSKITIGEWLDSWLNVTMKASIKNTTWLIYESLIRIHIEPSIGGIMLQKLKTADLQNLYNSKLADGRADGKGGLSAKTIKHIHQIIRNALDQAKKEGFITINPAEATRLPKLTNKEMQTLSIEQVTDFFVAVTGNKAYFRYYAAYILELYTGLRRGELLGLRWKDIDLVNGKISIIQQVTLERGTAVIRELKTEASQNRVIAIPSEVIQALKEHKQRKIIEYTTMNLNDIEIAKMVTEGLVFTSQVGSVVHPSRFVKNFKSALKAAKLPTSIRFHDMRHTFVLLSLQQGVDIKTIQSDLGHNDISTTLDRYGHVNNAMKQDAASKRSLLLKDIIGT